MIALLSHWTSFNVEVSMEFIAVLMDPSRNTYLASKTVKVYLIIIM